MVMTVAPMFNIFTKLYRKRDQCLIDTLILRGYLLCKNVSQKPLFRYSYLVYNSPWHTDFYFQIVHENRISFLQILHENRIWSSIKDRKASG